MLGDRVKQPLNNAVMPSELWQRLRAVRKHTKLSGEAFGAACGVSKAAVSQWESPDPEKRTRPDLQKVIDMARSYSIPLDWLLDDRSDVEFQWWVDVDGFSTAVDQPPPLQLADAIPLVLDAIETSPARDELRQLLPLLVTGAPAYRQRLTELLTTGSAAARLLAMPATVESAALRPAPETR
jgi:transcriptional regulator with XRE-family HTH domain